MKVYQAGCMRGQPNFGFQLFEDGMWFLREQGLDVVSPHEIDLAEHMVEASYKVASDGRRVFDSVLLTHDFTFEKALARDFAELTHCDAISFLPKWYASEGARKELHVATWCGLKTFVHNPPVGSYFEPFDVSVLVEAV